MKKITLGAETEALTTKSFDDIVTGIQSACIPGVLVRQEKDPATDRNMWVVQSDSTIVDGMSVLDVLAGWKGVEIASAVFFDDGDSRVIWHGTFSRVLHSVVGLGILGFRVNNKCGVHVHLGAGFNDDEEFALVELQKGSMLWIIYEADIDRMHPEHRLDNFFCRSNRENLNFLPHELTRCLELIQDTTSIQTLQTLMCPNGRNYKMNLFSLNNHSTIEFRQHEGTLDPDVICTWADFLLDFLRKAMSLSFDEVRQLDAELNPLIPQIVAVGPRYLR